MGLGRALLAVGRLKEARDQLTESEGLAEDKSQQAAIYYWRARTLEQMGNAKAAAVDWKALVDLPDKFVSKEWVAQAQQQLTATVTPTSTAASTITPAVSAPEASATPTPAG